MLVHGGVDKDAFAFVEPLLAESLFVTAGELHEDIPHAEVIPIEGQGHIAAAFAPGRFARAVLSFTARHDG